MLTPQLRKFSALYDNYGLGAVRNLYFMVKLLLIGRTVNLWKLKDYVAMVLGNVDVQPHSHYKRLTRFLLTGRITMSFSLTFSVRFSGPCDA